MPTSKVSLKAQGTLLHYQLFLTLRQQILDGVYLEGQQLPTQDTLTRQFKVSRITVRRALSELQTEGLIRNEQGVGSFVLPNQRKPAATVSLTYLQGLKQVVHETRVLLILSELAKPPLTIARAIGLSEDKNAVHVVRVRERKGTPLMLLDAWMLPRFAPILTASALRSRPLYELLISDGTQLGEVVQEVTAEMADPNVADHLKIKVNSPVLRTTRLVYDSKQQPLQYLVIRATPLRSRMVMSISGKELNTVSAGHLVHDVG
ncbi:GntR family transcriptional regulator [Advenella kashmirensis W13003]|uniref:GntR family transcriptional regulator n=1 Tax=Advenella kashmirensis W13003 TaxID=1424334 RepID=V8QUG9_9BURK|nr:GntR family transcriptional regulator [Advenella kashmirensis]ETF02998.1 GntR family transcriptional regulator [Advenella kashmirensis W13003]